MEKRLSDEMVLKIRNAVKTDREVPAPVAVVIKLLCNELLEERRKK